MSHDKDDILGRNGIVRHAGAGPYAHASMKLPGIEAARGVAAVLVVLYHAARHLKANLGFMPMHGVTQFGHAGVDFFFVLSGFIIMFVHRKDLGQPSRLAHYFQRRFTRIYPFFWFSLLVGTLLAAASHSGKPMSGTSILYAMTLLPTREDLGVAWTLQYEILFYLIFAIAIINLRAGAVIGAAWTCLVAYAWILPSATSSNLLVERLASPFNIEFFFGLTAAWLVARKNSFNAGALRLAGAFLFFGAGMLENAGIVDGYASTARIAYGLGAMAIVMGLALPRAGDLITVPSAMVQLGTASYSIYLMHVPCIGIAYKLLAVAGLLPLLPVWVTYIVLAGSGVAGGVLTSRLVEVPLTNGVRHLFRFLSTGATRIAR